MTRPDDDLRTLRDAGVLLRCNHDEEIPQWIRAHARRQAERRHGERRMEPEPILGGPRERREFVAGLAVLLILGVAFWLGMAVAVAAQ